eukprot:gene12759-13977_t
MKRVFRNTGESSPFHPAYSLTQPANNLRVLQFNILADGLSGLRADLGGFSRVKKDFMVWEYRRNLLLAEILQYDPDIITLQECDHYYDFFFPMLYSQGYDGVFAPKPASACLEVSSNPDGCAIFYRRSKLKVLSSEIGTYALSKTELKGLPPQKEKSIQNQVYAILCLQFLANAHSNSDTDQSALTPALILATTHLKASKTEEGERFRFLEVKELLENIKIFEENLRRHQGKRAAILLTGDLNACPFKPSVGATDSVGEGKVAYDSSVYQYLKAHSYKFRSVLNDDLQDIMRREGSDAAETIWTTWKARRRSGNQEAVAKHCIDYVLYEPFDVEKGIGIQPTAIASGFSDKEVDQDYLFPNPSYASDHISIVADLEVLFHPSQRLV